MIKIVIIIIAALLTSCAQKESNKPLNLKWQVLSNHNNDLPSEVKVYEGIDINFPLKAWYVKIPLKDPDIKVDVVRSDDRDGRETVSSFAEDLGACIVVNGGFFRMDLDPTRHVGLLAIDDEIIQPSTKSVIRDSIRYYIARGAVGFDDSGNVDIGWASNKNDTLYEWKSPFQNMPLRPIQKPDYVHATIWDYPDVLSAGPILMQNGNIQVALDAEVFFGTSIPKIHPRTAVGYTSEGDLLLLVVDGRQSQSRGVDLTQLAGIMNDLGAFEALNLDGGGSSSIVVNGTLLNRPAGVTNQREVMSAIVVHCD